jgi:hypothetical protein
MRHIIPPPPLPSLGLTVERERAETPLAIRIPQESLRPTGNYVPVVVPVSPRTLIFAG